MTLMTKSYVSEKLCFKVKMLPSYEVNELARESTCILRIKIVEIINLYLQNPSKKNIKTDIKRKIQS